MAEESASEDEVTQALTTQQGVLWDKAWAQAGNEMDKSISNPLDFSKGFPPSLLVSNTDSLGEQLQRAFPQVKVVKGLNTLTSFLMVAPRMLPDTHHIFLCGNDAGAKQEVRALLSSFGWADGEMIDLGDITNARGTEQLLPIWVRLYGAMQNPMFNFKVVVARA